MENIAQHETVSYPISKIIVMKNILVIAVLIFVMTGCTLQKPVSECKISSSLPSFVPPQNNSRFRLFDLGWKFRKGELSGAEFPDFDDNQWKDIDLPHDWSIEDLPDQKEGEIIGPFDKNSIGAAHTGYTLGGTAWYRKTFVSEEADQGKEISIYFDGVYMESDVWINGHYLRYHPNGYTPFYYKLNGFLNPVGQENTLAIQVKNLGKNSRWYSGSGIYRHVWLRVTELLNIPVWGVFITTPEVSEQSAHVKALVSVDNNGNKSSKFIIKNTIINPSGKIVSNSEKSETLDPGEKKAIEQLLEVLKPSLWSIEQPLMYTLKTELITDGRIIDSEETFFGIRSISFSPENGFLLNGKQILLQGACIHHDNGPLGSAAFDRADQRKIEILKAAGFNAIRSSHNPPSVGFLNACDRLGMLVMDEAFDMWEKPKFPDDYHRFFHEWHKRDLQSMLLRDRNHPSIIMWSIGNEIPERADTSGLRIAKKLISIVQEVDPSRPVTQAICDFSEIKGLKWDDSAPAFKLLDVCGYNYKFDKYEEDHAQYPERVIAGTESFPMSIYENWKICQKKPYVIGDFVWTGMDYLGEAGIGQVMADSITMCWPWINSNCGDIDLIGYKKQQSYYRDIVWDRSKLEMAVEEIAPDGKKWLIRAWGWRREYPSWNWPGNESKNMNVYVYTKCDEVRLELNGRIIASQNANRDSKFIYVFSVPYEPGELKAVAISNGKELVEKSLKTTGAAERVKIISDRVSITTNRNDLAYMTIELVDANGERVPDADANVKFNVVGEAEIVGVDNGNPLDPKSFQAQCCNAFHGRCLVILRPNGKSGIVTITAQSDNLTSAKCTIEIQ